MTAAIEIVGEDAADRGHLFGLAKTAFGGVPGWDDGRVLDALARDVVFVACEHGVPAGYVALRRERDGGFVVEQLLVAVGHERRGIGHALLAHAEGFAIAEHAPYLRVVVERANAPARDFYARSGFVAAAPELVERVLPREG